MINKKQSYNTIYYQKHKEESKQKQHIYYETHKNNIKHWGKKYYIKNKNRINNNTNEYYIKNKENILIQHKEYYITNKDVISQKSKIYRKNNADKIKEMGSLYYKNNAEKIKKRTKKYITKRLKEDITFRLIHTIRSRIKSAIISNSGTKLERYTTLLGCSIEICRKHLESQFREGMSWENYGKYGWHIDHIKPCASFDLSDLDQQRECFNYKNLQPLWASENLSKGCKISS